VCIVSVLSGVCMARCVRVLHHGLTRARLATATERPPVGLAWGKHDTQHTAATAHLCCSSSPSTSASGR
jgi:hypothetical protein